MIKVIASILIISGLLMAQPMEKPNCLGCQKDLQIIDRPEHPQFMDKKPREMMETIRIWKLTEALQLSDEQSTRFFPKLKEMRGLKDENEQNRMKTLGELDDLLKDTKKFGSEIKNKMQDLEKNDIKFQENTARLKKEIASILTPEQQAKFMLFQMRFDKEMHEMISKVRERGNQRKEMRQGRREERREGRKQWRFW